MAIGRAIFQAYVDGPELETVPIAVQWSFDGTTLEIRSDVTLNAGDNTIAIPVGTKLIVFEPPVTNANALKLKQTGADSGNVLQPNMANVLTWSSGGFVLNAGGSITGCKFRF